MAGHSKQASTKSPVQRRFARSQSHPPAYFIRLSVAQEIYVLVQYRHMSTQQAAEYVIHKEVASLKDGEGGVIVLDTGTAPVWSFNTLGMFRARQVQAPQIEVGK
jgi:L-asparaginase / beta-aspartyl-peptidase